MNFKLSDLEPKFLKIENERTYKMTDDLAGSDGISFVCPKCYIEIGGRVGAHSVICWRPHVPQTFSPTPGRWNFEGSGYSDLTLVSGSSSVLLMGGCNAHFFIRNGNIEMCG